MRKSILSGLFFILLSFVLQAQADEFAWMNVRPVRLTFKINQEEIPRLLQSKQDEKAMQQVLHTLVDSTEEPGHYLNVSIHRNIVEYEHRQVVPFQIYHFKEYGVLCFQVVDNKGRVRDDAIVELSDKQNIPIPYDKKTHSFRIDQKQVNNHPFVRISLDGFDAWFSLYKIYGGQHLRRKNDNEERSRLYSYMLTDKNKYKPGESVRFKSYALYKEKRPVTDSLVVWLNNYSKRTKVKTIASYHPGGYAGEILLHDSLELKLNEFYYINLETPGRQVVATTSFYYEDYELSKKELNISQKHYQHSSRENSIDIELADANGLPIPDVTTTITITPLEIKNSYTPLLILPDTLLHEVLFMDRQTNLNFTIPNSIFKESDIRYHTTVTIQGPDNFVEKKSFTSHFSYNPDRKADQIKKEILFECLSGNLEIIYTENNVPVICKAVITCDGNETKEVYLPYKEPLKQSASYYKVEIPDKEITRLFKPDQLSPGFELETIQENNQIHIELLNPTGLDVSWFVYSGEVLQGRGYGRTFKETFPIPDPNIVHTVELFYHLGNTEEKARWDIKPYKEQLTITHDLPERVYPGQQIETTILITDDNGKPVQGVDLTAFAYNNALNYNVQDLDFRKQDLQYRPYPGTFRQNMSILHKENRLDYSFWKTVAGFDSIFYYRFTHPQHEIVTYSFTPPDSVTQFAPVIVWQGEFYLPHIIECDGIPVWFSWTDYPDTYSFRVSPDEPHNLCIYVGEEKITLNNIFFPAGQKTILAIDPQYLPGEEENTNPFKLQYLTLTDEQKERYLPYASIFKISKAPSPCYIRQGERYDRLYSYSSYPKQVGPFPPGEYSFCDSITFDLQGGRTYMLTTDSITFEPDSNQFTSSRQSVYTSLYLVEQVMKEICYSPDSRGYSLPVETKKQRSPVSLAIKDNEKGVKLTLILPAIKDNPGISRIILYNKNKSPEEFTYLENYQPSVIEKNSIGMVAGEYAFFILYKDGRYIFHESIHLKENHTFFLQLNEATIHPADRISEKLPSYNSETIPLYVLPPIIEEEEESANVLFVITEEERLDTPEEQTKREQVYEEIRQLNRLRSHFSDVAFWQPQLVTDKQGTVHFPVTFPDNITRWSSVIYAADQTLRTGNARQQIRAYNPIIAELSVPRFLVNGDSCFLNGSIRNYAKDQLIHGKSRFIIQQDSLPETDLVFSGSHRQQQVVKVSDTDSLTVAYSFVRKDGYMDGEQHSIPVARQGTEIAEGFSKLMSGTDTLYLQAAPGESLTVKLSTNEMDTYLDILSYLRKYPYACNEQLASRLKGLLNIRLYALSKGETFLYDKEVKTIIDRLCTNQMTDGLWGWWGNSGARSSWMSGHIMEALAEAKEAGYSFRLSYKPTVYTFNLNPENIEWLCALLKLYPVKDYKHLPGQLQELVTRSSASTSPLSLKKRLLIYEVLQQHADQWNPEMILPYLNEHPSGTLYCMDKNTGYWYDNHLITTAIAYRIIEKEPVLEKYKIPMRAYLLSNRQRTWNTYQASVIVSSVLPGYIKEAEIQPAQNSVQVTGKMNKEITGFPFEITLQAGEKLAIRKTGTSPLFTTVYSHAETTSAVTTKEFSILTTFENGDQLTAGEPVVLNVYVTVNEPMAEHVMIEVPIPAGCSYYKAFRGYSSYETHREYYKEKTVIFARQLKKGQHHYKIYLLPRFTGVFHLNPAKVCLMYFPYVCTTTDMRKVQIQKNKE